MHDLGGKLSFTVATTGGKQVIQKVVTKEAFPRASLVLVPFSVTVGSGSKAPANALELHDLLDPNGKRVCLFVAPKTEFPKGDNTGAIVPYFCVPPAADSTEANLVKGTMQVKLSSLEVGGGPLKQILVSNREETIHLPIMYNSKAISSGTALLYDASSKKRASDAQSPKAKASPKKAARTQA
eukprot:5192927-Pyramimonas_sp.AAC.1